jgi:hypothetical protein
MHRSYCTKFVTDDFAIQRIPTAKDYIGDGVIVSQAQSLHSLCGAFGWAISGITLRR